MNKNLLFSILCLTSCVINNEPLPYKCTLIDDDTITKYGIHKGNYLCFPQDVIDQGHSLNYSQDEFADFIDYAIINKKTYKTHNQDNLFSMYYADKYGDKIPSSTTIHIIDTKMFNDYDEYKRKKVAAQKEKEETAKITKIAKQNPEIRKKLKNQFFNRCEYNMQNGRVQLNQNYIQKMCECLACVFNGTPASDNAVYEYVEKNKQTLSSSEYISITYGFYDQCDKYVTGIADFNPCKWANGEYPF